MRIFRTLERDGTLGPAALNYLPSIPQQYVFFREQQLRHPASIYNRSLEKLAKAFVSVAERYSSDTAKYSYAPNETFDLQILLDAQEHLLRCLQEHLADCYLILKTLVNRDTTKAKTLFADQYVLDAKLPGAKAFMQAITDYKISLRIADKLKHNQGRLRGIAIYPEERVRLGYFLEEPDSDGTLGPSPDLHPNRGAFSFARDLTWRFFLVYSLSESLITAVERALAGLHQVTVRPAGPPRLQAQEWDRLAVTVAKIDRSIFPKENGASLATVRVTDDGSKLSMKFPDQARIVYPPLPMRTVISIQVDEFSRQVKVPFP
jgi:hypothetical protein